LRFNTHPARIFMGDGGSQFLGLAVGVLALMLTQGERTDFSPLLPLLVLGLPLLDTAMVMVQRVVEGRSPFSADRNHIHHRLLGLGLSHYEVVFVIYVFQAGLAATAYVLRYAPDITILAVYGVFCSAVTGILYFAQHRGWRMPRFSQRRLNQLKKLGRDGLFARLAHGYVLVAMPIFMITSAVFASGMSGDIALLGLILLLLCSLEWIRNRQARISWTERGVIYIVAAVLLYMAELGRAPMPLSQLFFGALAIAVVLGFRYSADTGFAATPSDFLIIFLAIALPILPQAQQIVPLWTAYIPKLVVLYYGIEMALSQLSGRRNMVRTLTFTTLGIVLIRGLL
jgi:UDP-GlcNAc:undecaprenyl-phosphate GlcNAc-1-phosphate transferase